MDNYLFKRVFSRLPEIETKRLVLKKIVPDNAFQMYEYSCQSAVTKYLLWSPHLNLHETKGYIEYLQKRYKKGQYADWGLNLKSNGDFIGTCGFSSFSEENNSGEIGYVLSPKYQNQGFMKEAVSAILIIAFENLALNRVELRIMEGNLPSIKLAESLNFKYEGALRKSLLVKGEYKTVLYYSLLSKEFYGI